MTKEKEIAEKLYKLTNKYYIHFLSHRKDAMKLFDVGLDFFSEEQETDKNDSLIMLDTVKIPHEFRELTGRDQIPGVELLSIMFALVGTIFADEPYEDCPELLKALLDWDHMEDIENDVHCV